MKRMWVTCHTAHDGLSGRPRLKGGRVGGGDVATVASVCLRVWVKHQREREREREREGFKSTECKKHLGEKTRRKNKKKQSGTGKKKKKKTLKIYCSCPAVLGCSLQCLHYIFYNVYLPKALVFSCCFNLSLLIIFSHHLTVLCIIDQPPPVYCTSSILQLNPLTIIYFYISVARTLSLLASCTESGGCSCCIIRDILLRLHKPATRKSVSLFLCFLCFLRCVILFC